MLLSAAAITSPSTEAAPSASQWVKEDSAAPVTMSSGLGILPMTEPTAPQTLEIPGTSQGPPPVADGAGTAGVEVVGDGDTGGVDAADAVTADVPSAAATTSAAIATLMSRRIVDSSELAEIAGETGTIVEAKRARGPIRLRRGP